MNFNVLSIPQFDKQAKRLSKKYPSLKNELAKLINGLKSDPTQGKSLGSNFYKVRIAIQSKGKGKSGGGRVITFVKLTEHHVILTAIFDKSEKATLSEKELEKLFTLLP